MIQNDDCKTIETLFSVRDKVVLITGAGGLAEMYAYGFAKNGAHVILASKTLEKAERICKQLQKDNYPCASYPLFIEDKEAVETLTAEIISSYGRIDVCVHTAAACVLHDTLEDNEEIFDLHTDVNVKGSLNINRIVGNEMVKSGGGSIININTMSADSVNSPDGFSYSVSKAALKQLTKWFAVAYAPSNVRVNGIAPIWIRTPMMSSRSEDYWNKCVEQVPMGRVANAEDYLGIALYMASDAGKFMTGQTILVDGGWSVSRVFKFDNQE